MLNEIDTIAEMASYIDARLSDAIIETEQMRDAVTFTISAAHLQKTARLLHDDPQCMFLQLSDITAVDWPQKEMRFQLVYHLLSVSNELRARLKINIEEGETVPSVSTIWPSANWYEREVWDMYGIAFSGHPDLRRILTDYGFEGHPQRKDFPLTGHVELRYDVEAKRCVYEPVSLTQDFRSFDFLSPWEGMTPDAPKELSPQADQDRSDSSDAKSEAG